MGRHKSIERPPTGQSIRIVLEGQRYEATYTVDGSIVAVESLTLGARRGQITDDVPEVLAKLLLAELVYESQRPRLRRV